MFWNETRYFPPRNARHEHFFNNKERTIGDRNRELAFALHDLAIKCVSQGW